MLANKFLNINYNSQEDFENNFKINIPEGFNFAYDIVDEYANIEPDKRAMIWTNLAGEEKTFTFGDFAKLSNQAANVFKEHGLKKGDTVLVILKRRYEFWICILALMKLGCVFIPATHQLAVNDIIYRANASKSKAIICVDEESILNAVKEASPCCGTVDKLFTISNKSGFVDLCGEMLEQSETFDKPEDFAKNEDLLLIYFTSGTTGMPKIFESLPELIEIPDSSATSSILRAKIAGTPKSLICSKRSILRFRLEASATTTAKSG